jgi:hypothetical protein
MKQNSWTRAAIGVFVLIILTVLILHSHQAQATFTATGTSLTGDSNSTIDVTGTLGIGNTNTTSIILGQLGQSVTLPGNLILPGITGLTQCLQVNSSGQISGTGSVCGGSGGGNVTGPASSTQYEVANYADTTGLLLGRSGILMNLGQATFGATLLSTPKKNIIPSYLASSNWSFPMWQATDFSGSYDNQIRWGYNCEGVQAGIYTDDYWCFSMEHSYLVGGTHQNEYYIDANYAGGNAGTGFRPFAMSYQLDGAAQGSLQQMTFLVGSKSGSNGTFNLSRADGSNGVSYASSGDWSPTQDTKASLGQGFAFGAPHRWLHIYSYESDPDTVVTNGFENHAALGAPVNAIVASTPTSGGSCTAGTHSFKYDYMNNFGDGIASSASNQITCVSSTGQTVPLAIPVGPAGTTLRRLWATKAGGSTYYSITWIDNTSATYNFTTADGSLGSALGTGGAGTVDQSAGIDNRVAGVGRQLVGQKYLTSAAATTILSVPLATLKTTGGFVSYTIKTSDGTNQCALSGSISYVGENSAAVFVVAPSAAAGNNEVTACTSGSTLTDTWSLTAANPALLQVTATTSITSSTNAFTITYETDHHGETQSTVQ